MNWNRRELIGGTAAAASIALLPGCDRRVPTPVFDTDPFTLGVASGYPEPDSVVLWTRLAPAPLETNGGMDPEDAAVEWQVAEDDNFTGIVASGTTIATPELAHSVRTEVSGLLPGRDYYYRFICGDAESAVGRTRTAPRTTEPDSAVRLGVACCQHYESGHYAALDAMATDHLDAILHLGDYIYETAGVSRVRSHELPEAVTLDDYRRRYALYKLDPALQRAHASCPWLVTWDDHEVDNDYADAVAEDQAADFLARRAAAYQAYYEHLPLPPRMRPQQAGLRLHTRASFGSLVDIHLLDGRQYRSPQACGYGLVEPCPEMTDPERSMLGRTQERWLADSLSSGNARWNLLAQQTVFAGMDQQPGPGIGYWSDGWSGYPAARDRLVNMLSDRRIANPVFLSGDLHAFLVNDIHHPEPGRDEIVASEFVTTSISSAGPPQQLLDSWQAENEHVRFAGGGHRGYLRLYLEAKRLDAELIAVNEPANPDSGTHRLSAWHVLNGRPGAIS